MHGILTDIECPVCQEFVRYDEGSPDIANAHYCSDCAIWRNIGSTNWTNGADEDEHASFHQEVR